MSFETVRRWGWRAVELAAMAVVFCLLARIILGSAGGPVVNAVADNAVKLAQDVPEGTLVGLGLLALVYAWVRNRS
jgi:hypothetical protein